MSKKGHDFHFQIPTWPTNIWAKLRRLAKAERRTVKQVILIAIEKHLRDKGVLLDDDPLTRSSNPNK